MDIQTVKQHNLFPLICAMHSAILCLIEETTVAKVMGEYLYSKKELSNKESNLLEFVADWYINAYEMLEGTTGTLMSLICAAATNLGNTTGNVQEVVDQYQIDVYPEWSQNRAKCWDVVSDILTEEEILGIENSAASWMENSPAYSSIAKAINGIIVVPEDTLLESFIKDIVGVVAAEADNAVKH